MVYDWSVDPLDRLNIADLWGEGTGMGGVELTSIVAALETTQRPSCRPTGTRKKLILDQCFSDKPKTESAKLQLSKPHLMLTHCHSSKFAYKYTIYSSFRILS